MKSSNNCHSYSCVFFTAEIEIDATDSASIQVATGASQTVKDATFRDKIKNFYNEKIRGMIYIFTDVMLGLIFIGGIAIVLLLAIVSYFTALGIITD